MAMHANTHSAPEGFETLSRMTLDRSPEPQLRSPPGPGARGTLQGGRVGGRGWGSRLVVRFGKEPERASSIKRASNSKIWKEGCSELGFDALKHWLIATLADDDCLCPELVDFVLRQHLGFTAGHSLATHANLACLSGVCTSALYICRNTRV